MERFISMQDPFQFKLHQFRMLVSQQRQAGARTVQLIQVNLSFGQGFLKIWGLGNQVPIGVEDGGSAPVIKSILEPAPVGMGNKDGKKAGVRPVGVFHPG
jgi:hypothetical protein